MEILSLCGEDDLQRGYSMPAGTAMLSNDDMSSRPVITVTGAILRVTVPGFTEWTWLQWTTSDGATMQINVGVKKERRSFNHSRHNRLANAAIDTTKPPGLLP
ncbi:hypothetical protein PsorP6_001318 [Peronosclerospora sorghi]|uniref:Uncharacterized protein n=1 Tax=Peronosclerospora sorghi TaxID=230839 RepID=A0ACC0WW87_9STRA|nr:hypothetical protein PsorP6_001318 [Peronosclerospora sorghi]